TPDRIVTAADCPIPFTTAAERAAELLDLPVEVADSPVDGALNIAPPAFADGIEPVTHLLSEAPDAGRWDVICELDDGGWIVTGSSPLATAHATLTLVDWIRWNEPLEAPFQKLRTSVLRSLHNEFDDLSAGFARLADGFDMQEHLADAVRLGLETQEVNLIADATPVQVKQRRNDEDVYQWWSIYSPALDMFVESSVNEGTYRPALLERNMEKLQSTAQMVRAWGMTPTFIGFEPRAWPERLFDRYPHLRGPRVDYMWYSAEPEFAPDPNHPLVRRHYAEMMANLMEAIPDLGLFSVWSQDSCAGFPWAQKLYPEANGPIQVRKRPIEKTVSEFMSLVAEIGREVNPDLQVTLCTTWFVPDECERIWPALPEGIGASQTLGADPDTGKHNWEPVRKMRDNDIEPQVQLEGISNWWKPLGPMLGFPFPYFAYDRLCDVVNEGGVKDLILRGGFTSGVFVPYFINNEVIRAFQAEGPSLDVGALLQRRAQQWARSDDEASAMVEAWRLCDEVSRNVRVLSWTMNFVSGRTLWRKLVKPIVPDQTQLDLEDYEYYRDFEYIVPPDDPAWWDNFYMGYRQMVSDEDAREGVQRFDDILLPRMEQAIEQLDSCETLSETGADLLARIRCMYHVFVGERNMIAAQEAIHRCVLDNRDDPATSDHAQRVFDAVNAEINNTRQFIELLETTDAVLIPATSGTETTFMLGAPVSHLLRRKLQAMLRHRDDAPGPWFPQLETDGEWVSDRRYGDPAQYRKPPNATD
ncbi:MAG: hypothetical protein R6V19_04550, partial [Armatimonadota bacterium]